MPYKVIVTDKLYDSVDLYYLNTYLKDYYFPAAGIDINQIEQEKKALYEGHWAKNGKGNILFFNNYLTEAKDPFYHNFVFIGDKMSFKNGYVNVVGHTGMTIHDSYVFFNDKDLVNRSQIDYLDMFRSTIFSEKGINNIYSSTAIGEWIYTTNINFENLDNNVSSIITFWNSFLINSSVLNYDHAGIMYSYVFKTENIKELLLQNSKVDVLTNVQNLKANNSMLSVDLSAMDTFKPILVSVNAEGKDNILYVKGVLDPSKTIDYAKFVGGTVLADLARNDVNNDQRGFFTNFVAYKDDVVEVKIDNKYIVEFQKENGIEYYIPLIKGPEVEIPTTVTLMRATQEKLENLDAFIASQYLNLNNLSKRSYELRHNGDFGVWSRGYTSRIAYLDTASRQHEFFIGADKHNSFNGFDLNSGIYFTAGYRYHNNLFDIKQNLYGVGIYNTFIKDKFFLDTILSYSHINNDFKNFLVDKKVKNNLLQASLEGGYRFGNDTWIEPSLKLNFAYGLGFDFENERFSIKKDKKLFVSADAKLDFGTKVNEYVDIKAGLGYTYDFTTPNDTNFKYLGHNFITQVKKDKRFNVNVGSNFHITDKFSISVDFERSFKGFYNIEYQLNSSFKYVF